MKDVLIIAVGSIAVFCSPICGFGWNALVFIGAGSIASFLAELL